MKKSIKTFKIMIFWYNGTIQRKWLEKIGSDLSGKRPVLITNMLIKQVFRVGRLLLPSFVWFNI